jgi:hypothetical protein
VVYGKVVTLLDWHSHTAMQQQQTLWKQADQVNY